MPILWRSWIALTALIAVVLTSLSLLSILQHDAILAKLIQQRLSVVAQTTAASFRPMVNLGLPLSAVRNAVDILKRSRELDPEIRDIHVFNPTGIVVRSTAVDGPDRVSKEILLALSLSEGEGWSVETESELNSGFTVTNSAGDTVGAVVVVYPKDRFNQKAQEIARRIELVAMLLFVALSLATLVVVRIRLGGAIQGLTRIKALLRSVSREADPPVGSTDANNTDSLSYGFFRHAIDDLEVKLVEADAQYQEALKELTPLAEKAAPTEPLESSDEPVAVASIPESSLARIFTRQLTPWVAGLVILAVLILGYYAFTQVRLSFGPELSARTTLIGTVANRNIQRAVTSGVPLGDLVGAEQYFDDLLRHFPEISYFGVATGRIILEAGSRQQSPFAPRKSRKDVPTFPITSDGTQIGYVIVDADPGYFAVQFRDVLLDLGVLLIVVVLLAFEVMVVVISVSLTGPFNRLQHLVSLQAVGDFSKCLGVRGRNAVDQLDHFLSERAEHLHRLYARAAYRDREGTIGQDQTRLESLVERFSLRRWQPQRLQFSYLNDVRLPLFLFGAADELPISFLPVFTRSVDNPLSWLDLGVVLSLPLAGYLLAVVVGAPIARPLAERFGHRKLLLFAVVPTVIAHIGLYAATSTVEIILFRTLSGFGYAIATLVCQDYVLDVVPPESRNRSLGLFTAALFGGIFAGTAMGGILADRFGPSFVFMISAVLVMVSGMLALKLMPARGGTGQATAFSFKVALPPIGQPLRSARFASLVFAIAIPANVLLQAFISYLVALQLDALSASAADIARVLMTYFLAIALIGPVAPRLLDRYLHPAQIGFAGALISATGLCLAALSPTYWSVLAAVVGAGIGHSLVRDPQVAVAMEIAETDLRELGPNAVLGSLRTIERVGSIVGLIAIALLSSYAGYAVAIGAVGVWVLIGALVFLGHAWNWRAPRTRKQG